jgi:hypothetical protein
MIRRHVHLTRQQIAKLESLAKADGLTFADHVRRAVDGYNPRPPRQTSRKAKHP